MKISARSLARYVVYTVAGISLSLLLPQTSWAQTANDFDTLPTEVNPLQDFDPQQQNSDPFSRANEEDGFGGGIYDLMHRAQMGNIRSINEYSSEQNQSLDTAAAEFRARQRERMIQGQQQVAPVNPVNPTPQPSN